MIVVQPWDKTTLADIEKANLSCQYWDYSRK
jgi:ribosome recycling factor